MKRKDIKKLLSENKGILIIFISLIVLIGIIAVNWLTTPLPSTSSIKIVDTYCSEGVVGIKIKSIATVDIESNSISVNRTSPAEEPNTPTTCCDSVLTPGETAWYIDPTCGANKMCVYRIGPEYGKPVEATVPCP